MGNITKKKCLALIGDSTLGNSKKLNLKYKLNIVYCY